MTLLARLLGKTTVAPASVARDRLRVIVEQTGSASPDYLPELRRDILDAIARYISIPSEDVNVTVTRDGNEAVLELNVALPE